MKKLLFVTAFPPNKRSGGQQYSLNALKDLSTKYQIDLIYFTYPGHEYEPVEGVRVMKTFNPNKLNCLFMPKFYPLFTRRFDRECLKLIKSCSSNYDVLYFDFSQVSIYSKMVNHPRKIIRCHDVIGQKFDRRGSRALNWIKKSEKSILESAHQIFVPSPKDCELLKDLYDLPSIYTHEYLHEYILNMQLEVQDRYIFFGLWSRKENLDGLIWFIQNVLPLDKEKNEYVVMGGGLPLEAYNKYLKPNHIKYLGFVDDSISELAKSKATIVPLFQGAGIKIKVLDSFSAGTPVIGTNISFEGIPNIAGLSYYAKTPESFIKQINLVPKQSLEEKKKFIKEFRAQYNNRHLTDFI